MDIAIHGTFLPPNDPDASPACYRDTLGFEVVQGPTEQPYGVRDCAFRDPAGNVIRTNEFR